MAVLLDPFGLHLDNRILFYGKAQSVPGVVHELQSELAVGRVESATASLGTLNFSDPRFTLDGRLGRIVFFLRDPYLH